MEMKSSPDVILSTVSCTSLVALLSSYRENFTLESVMRSVMDYEVESLS